MSIHIDVVEAQQRFLELIQAVSRGEAIIITKDMLPIAQITSAQAPQKRPSFGSARGMITITDQFDLPLDG